MNAIEENAFTRTLESLAPRLPRPKAVCVISAHWVTAGSEVLAVAKPKTIHDFYGFPRPLYEVQYPAPGAPEEAQRLAKELELIPDHKWGFDRIFGAPYAGRLSTFPNKTIRIDTLPRSNPSYG